MRQGEPPLHSGSRPAEFPSPGPACTSPIGHETDKLPHRMDSTTVQYYSDHAALQVQRYSAVESPALRHFAVAFSSGSRVLDVGCGSGRDLNALLKGGYDASGVDPCPEMLREAARVHPMVAGRSSVDKLPDLATVPAGAVDGVLCEAVLMHVPEEHLFDTVFNLRRVLKAGGRLLISTPLAGPPVDPATRRDADGRLFNGVTPENFHFLLQKLGFQRLGRWDAADSLGRTERSWATQLFVLAGEGSRSLDTIEAILNRDKKDATYKPALFRALADLATKSYHSASWLPGGRVAIPMRLIADKWLEYYWPLFESATFIPQKRGEKRDCQKPVAFRASLESLIGLYRNRGGLSGFTVDYRSRGLAPQALALHAKAVSTICSTIRAGPVYFAGGRNNCSTSTRRRSPRFVGAFPSFSSTRRRTIAKRNRRCCIASSAMATRHRVGSGSATPIRPSMRTPTKAAPRLIPFRAKRYTRYHEVIASVRISRIM